ncbi:MULTISPECIES: hypothetical protein [Bacillus]|uniref:Uncharacterized protein n=1 Tax=Bacillus cereus (strain G9842) TaxID=405531 RepID=B7IZQ0_BACC2|nr:MULTISPECIES: hypothetical protein [Bacillus]ACK98765.1 hypothetical protein BCG9842_A0057 [Bacillus cereus G9842]KUF34409.1 hypothetical protein AMR94_02085 [Bacillus sp. G3(2015)]MDR4135883.1 hypothetical protein [Bacillus cereus]MDR4363608.1 hypothetical protein [Bacillus cereus]PEC95203.1 hypothetical protein CON17_20110 [Bacillus thuringiensis]
MSSAKDRMRNIHRQGNTNLTTPPPVKIDKAPPKIIQQTQGETTATVVEDIEEVNLKQAYDNIIDDMEASIVLRPKKHIVIDGRKIPKKVALFAREEGIVNGSYGSKRLQTSFDCANKEVHQWAKSFTTENQFNGGCSITKSDLIEICLDTFFYDLGLEPIGYESYEELREDIWRKMKEFKDK